MDFTKCEVQQRQRKAVLNIEKVPPCLRRSGYAQAGPVFQPGLFSDCFALRSSVD